MQFLRQNNFLIFTFLINFPMKMFNSEKGFTLIELLIVIAIIAVLAVAFLPTILGAPAKGRDTARIASLQKIQKTLISKDLEGMGYPSTTGDIIDTLLTGKAVPNDTWKGAYAASFGGSLPTDPQTGQTNNVKFKYYVKGDTAIGGVTSKYLFGLRARMETKAAGNSPCSVNGAPLDAGMGYVSTNPFIFMAPANNTQSCYVILAQ